MFLAKRAQAIVGRGARRRKDEVLNLVEGKRREIARRKKSPRQDLFCGLTTKMNYCIGTRRTR